MGDHQADRRAGVDVRDASGLPDADTIAAIATPPGQGGVGIVRISGPDAAPIVTQLTGSAPAPRRPQFRHFRDADGRAIDAGLVLYFPGPGSFTGEDVIELQGHGGAVVMQLLLARVLELGARLARPGEFSERAFHNGRMDLVQAEAVADLIGSTTAAAARAAVRSLDGAFSETVDGFQRTLTELRVFVEAAIDFPEEEIDFLADGEIERRTRTVATELGALIDRARQGRLLRDGLVIAIVGRPNAGKSSLLNALAQRDTAIVTAIPGTTRDVLREQIQLDGIPLHLVDTAGLRETEDEVEREGVRRALAELDRADHVLLVVDDGEPDTPEFAALDGRTNVTVLRNKIDLTDRDPGQAATENGWASLAISAQTGAGLDQLRATLKAAAGASEGAEGTFMARARHIDALRRAADHVDLAITRLADDRAGELAAEELRLAQQHLGDLTGEFSSDDLLGEIFSSFCIGK